MRSRITGNCNRRPYQQEERGNCRTFSGDLLPLDFKNNLPDINRVEIR